MLYILDTNTFSALMRRVPAVRANLARLLPSDQIAICAITRGEVQFGIARLAAGARRDELREAAEILFDHVRCLPVTDDAADAYALIRRAAELRGRSVAENDLWIAAVAQTEGAILVTADSDFSGVPDLTTEDWGY